MPTPLRVLIVEDSPTDAEVMLGRLREAGYAPDWRRVETEAEFLAHLEPTLDLILIDYSLPDFNGRRALENLHERGWDIPSIIVTGTISEETALELLQLGAADYLLKDRPARLGAAVRTALAHRSLQHERTAAETAWQASDARARFLADVLEKSSQPFGVSYPDGRVGICNAALCTLLGYTEAELRALDWSRDLTPPEWQAAEAERLAELQRTGQPVRYEKECLRKEGSRIPVEVLMHLARDAADSPPYYCAFVTDLTERKRAEARLQQAKDYAEKLIQTANVIVLGLDTAGHIQVFNEAAERITGYTRGELIGQDYFEVLAPRDRYPQVWEAFAKLVTSGLPTFENPILTRSGEERLISWQNSEIREEGKIVASISFGIDITERKRAEQALAERTRQLEAIHAITVEITQELGLSALLRRIIFYAAELTRSVSGAVYLWDEAAECLSPGAWRGYGDWMRDARLSLGQGVTGTVAERRQGMIVNDYRTSPYANPLLLARTGITATVAEPLLFRDRLTGVITINNESSGRRFTEQDREMLALFAAAATIAIENARLYAAEQERRRQVEAVQAVAAEITRELDLTAVLRLVTQRAAELVATPSGTVFLWEDESRLLVPRAQYGYGDWPADLLLRLGEGVAGAVAERRAGMIVNAYRTSPYALPVVLERTAITAVVAEPLIYGDRLLGVIDLSDRRPDRAFTEHDRDLLRLLAYPAAIAIENARLFQSVSDQRTLLRSLGSRLIETVEGERQRLALELHDQIGASLTALGLDLNILRAHPSDPEEAAFRARLDDSLRLVEQIAERIQDVVVELRPPALDDYGLVVALRWYGRQFASRSGIDTEVRGEDLSPRLNPQAELALFRIAQEALTNAARHAQASHVFVELEGEERQVRLTIADDGIGVDVSRSAEAGRQYWGLLGMGERAQAVGGRWRIESQLGAGTRIIAEVPR